MLNERLKEARRRKGITGKVAAEMLAMPYSTYSKYESGERTPDVGTVSTLASFYDVTTDYLIGHDSAFVYAEGLTWINELTVEQLVQKIYDDFGVLFSLSAKVTHEQLKGVYIDLYNRLHR